MDVARLKCEQCAQTFGLYKDLDRHVNSKHTNVTFKCDKCTFSTNRRDNLKRHKKTKHTLVTNDNATEPMDINREAGPSKYTCPQCPAEFKEKFNLNRHLKSKHDDAKMYLCEDCGQSFTRSDHFHNHKAQHKKRKAQKNIAPHPKKVRGRVESDSESSDRDDDSDRNDDDPPNG